VLRKIIEILYLNDSLYCFAGYAYDVLSDVDVTIDGDVCGYRLKF